MNSVLIIALAGIGGTLGAPVLSGWLQLRREEVARQDERRVELRGLLDDAGLAISEAIRILDRYRSAVLREATDVSAPETKEALWRCEDRLCVRLGTEHAIVREFKAAAEALGNARLVLQIVASTDGKERFDALSSADALRSEAMDAQRRYFNEARKVIGPKV